jgi:predicted transcriptional regulator of viral defense system
MSYSATRAPQLPHGRAQLALLLGRTKDVIRIEDAETALQLTRTEAAKRLARWTEQGWLHRVGRGTYVAADIQTMGAEQVLDDPWVLVPAFYAPAYVGGRTAAEHWDLTEQIFKDIVVFTAQSVRARQQVRHGATFTLRHLQLAKHFGTKTLWRQQTRVPVSDVHRTLIDMLDEPAIGGGIQHVADCLANYFKRSDRDDLALVRYANQLGNGAVFKRLGFLAERNPTAAKLTESCRDRLTAGLAKLDPAIDCPRVVSAWRLRVPQTWLPKAGQ